jgi:tRNA (guanine26-N2/guanine27-N2)-dimethyltransferase
MHDAAFVQSLLAELQTEGGSGAELASRQRLVGLLTSVAEELHDVPLFYALQQMCNTLRVQCPPLLSVMSALMRQGYRVSRSHTDANAIKTDAPSGVVWDVMRSWAEENPPTKLSETSAGHRLLAKPYELKADFTKLAAAEQVLRKVDAKGARLARFMPNPADWGPGSKGTAHAALGEYVEASSSSAASVTAAKADGGAAKAEAPAPISNTMLDKRAANQGKKSRKRTAPGEAQAEGAVQNGAGESDVKPDA